MDMHATLTPSFFPNRESFVLKWLDCLNRASKDFEIKSKEIWESVLIKCMFEYDFYGALPEDALQYYVNFSSDEEVSTLLTSFQSLHSTAMMNAESLRKLVRKFDKRNIKEGKKLEDKKHSMTWRLLPHLFTSNFMVAMNNLVTTIAFMQENLQISENDCSQSTIRSSYSSIDEEVTMNRAEELDWFHENVQNLTPLDLSSLVSHRGFHNVFDRTDIRPLENTLPAFEQAWTSGISLCECDVALTKDGKVLLAHDENFARLALMGGCDSSVKNVSDLTFKQILALHLKHGSRPPLLAEVLRSASAIGDHAKLIIEIKPGNDEMCLPLITLFARNPSYLNCVHAIMCFDSYIMKEISIQMDNLATRLKLKLGDQLFLKEKRNQHYAPNQITTAGTNGTITKSKSMLSKSLVNLVSIEIEESKTITPSVSTSSNLQQHPHNKFPSKQNLITSISSKNLLSSISSNNLLLSLIDIETTNMNNNHPKSAASGNVFVINMPKLLLLTVNEPSTESYEFCVNVKDFSIVDSWMNESMLDGVYIEYESDMLTLNGIDAMRNLSDKYDVGVWMRAEKHPDKLSNCRSLMYDCNVSYINTDFPPDFYYD